MTTEEANKMNYPLQYWNPRDLFEWQLQRLMDINSKFKGRLKPIIETMQNLIRSQEQIPEYLLKEYNKQVSRLQKLDRLFDALIKTGKYKNIINHFGFYNK